MKYLKNYKLLTLLLAFSSIISLEAQSAEQRERLKTAKIAHITTELDLSSEQAKQFWPLYNDFQNRLKELKKQRHRIDLNSPAKSEADILKELEKMHSLEIQEVELKKTYDKKMLNVISARQLGALYEAEESFKKIVLRRIRERMSESR